MGYGPGLHPCLDYTSNCSKPNRSASPFEKKQLVELVNTAKYVKTAEYVETVKCVETVEKMAPGSCARQRVPSNSIRSSKTDKLAAPAGRSHSTKRCRLHSPNS